MSASACGFRAAVAPTKIPTNGRRARAPRGGGAASRGPAKRTAMTPTRAMFAGFEKMLKGDPAEKTQKRYAQRVDAVNALGNK